MPQATNLTDHDLRQLHDHGISREEAERQLGLLTSPPAPPELVRPATAGDGIARIEPDRHDELVSRYRGACEAGRVSKLVPASGAASRMFKTLLPWVEYAGRSEAMAKEMSRLAVAGDPAAGDPVRFLSELPRFPFYSELARAVAAGGQDLEALRRSGEAGAILHVLLSPEHLGYDQRPKALVPFHRYGDADGAGADGGEVRTAFEEHLVEAGRLVADREGRARLHFTVPPESRERIEELLEAVRPRYEERLGARFEVSFSVQASATDTLALDPETGEPFRQDDGSLLLRPGGHGALLGNLQAAAQSPGGLVERGHDLDRGEGDLVLIKNIDNVQPDRVKDEVVRWKGILGGRLLELRERSRELHGRLSGGDGTAVEEAERFLAEHLGVQVPAAFRQLGAEERRSRLAERLDRPLRVGGMVVNRGEPGGGPFWVEAEDGTVSAQIVERSQIDDRVPGQVRVFNSSTHFNPVDLACAVRSFAGKPYDLPRYVDESAVFVAQKTHQGRSLLALERPGLWNGAMAGWNTAFVEVPEVTFSPVKTVFDLLRKEHQAT